jgi:hypothetical protein
MTITPRQREEIRMMFGGRCAYCGCLLDGKWHLDHVEPVERELKFAKNKDNRTVMVATGELYKPENDRIENLYPACVPCNIDKGSTPLEDWRTYLAERIVDGLRRNSSTFRHAERFGRVLITPGPLVFWFEKYREIEAEKRGAA